VKKNKSKYAVLGILSFGPMSGYDIKKFYEQSVASFWNESYGQIYPILKRLAQEGLATKSIQRQKGRPDRHIYAITESGRRHLRQWLVEPTGRQIGRHEIILKLIFGRQISVADNIRQIKRFRDRQVTELNEVEALKKEFQKEAGENSDLPYWLIAVEYGRYVNQAYIKWAEKAMAVLNEMLLNQESAKIEK
jgi:DNA-binding PadR family transcriptional regulator